MNRIIVILVLVAALGTGLYFISRAIFQAGYDSRVVEETEAANKQTGKHVEVLETDLEKALNRRDAELKGALALIEMLKRNKPKVSTNDELQKINSNPNCMRLGDDYVRLYNRAVNFQPAESSGQDGR